MTALLRVFNDITEALDQKCMVVMLDLSAAFDVIDHEILVKRLEYSYENTADVLSWIHGSWMYITMCITMSV